jgi:murein L,D-transpeptidase YafK
MKTLTRVIIMLFAAALFAAGYTKVMARVASGTPPEMRPAVYQADFVLVEKGARRLSLLRDGVVFADYRISLGADGDGGHKRFEGDQRTPEGFYTLDWRNPNSIAYLSLHISYPNAEDVAYAAAQGRDPGGHIMIHGIANGWGWLGSWHRFWDWPDGCIAVSNEEMREIWAHVANGTPIEIRP